MCSEVAMSSSSCTSVASSVWRMVSSIPASEILTRSQSDFRIIEHTSRILRRRSVAPAERSCCTSASAAAGVRAGCFCSMAAAARQQSAKQQSPRATYTYSAFQGFRKGGVPWAHAEAACKAVAVEYMHFEESLHVDGTRATCLLLGKFKARITSPPGAFLRCKEHHELAGTNLCVLIRARNRKYIISNVRDTA